MAERKRVSLWLSKRCYLFYFSVAAQGWEARKKADAQQVAGDIKPNVAAV